MADFNPLPNPYDKQTPNGIYWSMTDVAQKYGGSGILCPSKLKDTAAIDVRIDLMQLPAAKKKEIEDKMAGSASGSASKASQASAVPMDISQSMSSSSTAPLTSADSTAPSTPAAYPLPSPPSPAGQAPGSYPLPSPSPAAQAPKMGGASTFDAVAAALAQVTLPSHLRFLQLSSAGPTTITPQTGGRTHRNRRRARRHRKTRHRRRY